MNRAATSQTLSQDWSQYYCKCLHEQFDNIRSINDSQLGDNACRITDMIIFNSEINDGAAHTNGETSCSQTNPGCVSGIKMVEFAFGAIMGSAHWQRTFVNVILVHYVA
ncbi:hypothetical protein TNCV_4375401 [Trichonephila clavipes]|uniref:Uncharacterized protein n=1 Tax=Trichonephila clavipes TaxID=2585209 RepID=A0A8X7BDM2_TRICX|nr:hypothetical protein TNCV_4375401 [Trichonephila clavipes]